MRLTRQYLRILSLPGRSSREHTVCRLSAVARITAQLQPATVDTTMLGVSTLAGRMAEICDANHFNWVQTIVSPSLHTGLWYEYPGPVITTRVVPAGAWTSSQIIDPVVNQPQLSRDRAPPYHYFFTVRFDSHGVTQFTGRSPS